MYCGFIKTANVLRLLAIFALFSSWFSVAQAHSPHDVIDVVEISPTFEVDQTLFIVISDRIYRSHDGGYSWKELTNGLDTRSLYTDIALPSDFHESGNIFLATDGDGILRSQDAGDSWTRIDAGLDSLEVNAIETYPQFSAKSVLLAALSRGGLYKSDDAGDTWKEVIAANSVITAIAFHADEGRVVAYAGDTQGNIYASSDDGDTWNETGTITGAGAISALAFPPPGGASSHFMVGTEKLGLFEARDDGRKITPVNLDAAGQPIESIAFSPDYNNDQVVFVTTWEDALYVSNDGGRTWDKHGHKLTTDKQADEDLYRSPNFRDIRVSGNFADDRTLFVGGFDGLFKSTDGGENFIQLETLPVGMIRRLAVSENSNNTLSIIVSTYGGGVYFSDDDGKTWLIENKGVQLLRPGGITFSPSYKSDNTILAATRGYFLRSTDGGKTWHSVKLAPMSTWQNQAYRYLRKIGVPKSWINDLLVYADKSTPMATVIAVSPDFDSDKTLYFGTRWHGIYKSTDGGKKIEAIWADRDNQLPVSDLVLSNGFHSDGTLFAAFRAGGVFRSVDGGDSWKPVNSGLQFLDLWKSGIKHQLALYDLSLAISPDYTNDKTIFLGSSEGLYKSIDGGDSWAQKGVLDAQKRDNIIGLGISPGYKTDGTLLVSIRGKGLFLSNDRGQSFSSIAHDLARNNHSIELIEFSPRFPVDRTILVASDEQVFLTTDSGETWERLSRPVRYEDTRDILRYTGNWQVIDGDEHSAQSVTRSSTKGDKVSLDFIGTGITFLGPRSDDLGIASIELDGIHKGNIDQFSNQDETATKLFSVQGLALEKHTITVTVTGESNQNSRGVAVDIDAFDVATK